MTSYSYIGNLHGAVGSTGSSGAAGSAGSPGATGATGSAGSAGATGSAGSAGATGGTGAAGARGSNWYAGAGDPSVVALASWVPNGTASAPGDWYLNTVTGDYFAISA